MKITEVRVILTCPGRNYVLVKVMTDEGVYGVGDGTLNGSELAVAAAVEHCSHLLIGMDPQRIEDIWYFLYHHTYWRGGPVYAAAIGAIDIALWDIKGKVANMPVYQLLGGAARDKVLCYGHAGGRTPQEVEESVRKLQAKGYKVIRSASGHGDTQLRRAGVGNVPRRGLRGNAWRVRVPGWLCLSAGTPRHRAGHQRAARSEVSLSASVHAHRAP